MDHWITRFGCPESLHSDQGRIFEAKLFTSLTKLLQIDKTRTTAFHPQSNAVIERTNRTLLNMLAKTTDKHQRNWSELLPYVMLAYRTSVHESTSYTPYFLLFGHEATLPIDLQFPPPSDATWTNYHEYVAETRLRFHTAYEQARQYLTGHRNVSMHFITLKCMVPHIPKANWYSSIILQLPKDSVLNFILFGAVHAKSRKSSVK